MRAGHRAARRHGLGNEPTGGGLYVSVAPGAIGLAVYLSSSATTSPLVLAVDDLLAHAP